jgi:hypothetical protein
MPAQLRRWYSYFGNASEQAARGAQFYDETALLGWRSTPAMIERILLESNNRGAAVLGDN